MNWNKYNYFIVFNAENDVFKECESEVHVNQNKE